MSLREQCSYWLMPADLTGVFTTLLRFKECSLRSSAASSGSKVARRDRRWRLLEVDRLISPLMNRTNLFGQLYLICVNKIGQNNWKCQRGSVYKFVPRDNKPSHKLICHILVSM